MGFDGYLGNCTVTEVEFWGIMGGLKLTVDRIFEVVLIQTDIFKAQEDTFKISNSTLLKRIHQILTNVKQWKIQHIPREENTMTDSIVKMIRDRKSRLRLFENPPLQ
ncbi:hypothetical protein Golax_013936, partial [Gossypium laxum]|nr:hypothetical protein [Gossypium laxum]